MFLCCCCWLLNDEENIRRGKEEAEEPEFQNSFGIRNSSVCVCVRVPCIFGNTSTPLLLLLLLLCRLAKWKFMPHPAQKSKTRTKKAQETGVRDFTQHNTPKFQSISKPPANKQKSICNWNFFRRCFCSTIFVEHIFVAFLSTHFVVRSCVFVCACVCVAIFDFHYDFAPLFSQLPIPIRIFELRSVFISNSKQKTELACVPFSIARYLPSSHSSQRFSRRGKKLRLCFEWLWSC